jgi:hypothetical protein
MPNGSGIRCIDDAAAINEWDNRYSDAEIGMHVESADGYGRTHAVGVVSEESHTNGFDNIQYTGKRKEWLGCKASEAKLIDNHDIRVNTGNSSSRGSQCLGAGRSSSDFISSSQAFGDERSSTARSSLSSRDSCVTLSEYSVYSSNSNCSHSSRDSRESEMSISSGSQSSRESSCDLRNRISYNNMMSEDRSVVMPVKSPRQMIPANALKQITKRFPTGNLSVERVETKHKESSTQKLSGVISHRSTNTESPVTVPPWDKDNICVSELISVSNESRSGEPDSLVTSSTVRNGCGLNYNATEPSSDVINETKLNKSGLIENQFIKNYQESDNEENNIIDIYEVYDDSFPYKGHDTPPTEWMVERERITDQLHVYSARSMQMCSSLTNCSISDKSHNCAVPNSDIPTISVSCSRNESCIDEKPGETSIAMGVSSQNKASVAEEEKLVPSGLSSPATSGTCIFLTSLENNEDFNGTFDNTGLIYQQLSPANIKEFGRNVYSVPNAHDFPKRVRSSSMLKCGCESEGRTRFLLERLESGYFSDVPVSDTHLSAGEFTEAIIHARNLVRILECALDRTLPLNTDGNKAKSSPQHASTTRRKQRSTSLSPDVLRRCKRTDSSCSAATSELFHDREDRVLGSGTGTTNKEGVTPEHSSEAKPQLSCDIVSTRRCCYGDAAYMLRVSPEELRKQRALLKPAVDRRLHGAVVQVLDIADILKNAITRRRKFVDPSEEFTCGTNRSMSEWSLEST